MSEFDTVTLRNGSRALRERSSGEIMHPSVGPWDEANRLYVEQSHLAERLEEPGPEPLLILDIGLGGAANAVAALTRARDLPQERRGLEIVSFDRTLEPLRVALADPEGFPFLQPWLAAAEMLMNRGAWSGEGLAWRFVLGDFRARLGEGCAPADLIFFDPFSPSSAPELWSQEVFAALRQVSRDGGSGAQLFTYSAATPTRVALLLGGWFVGAGASVATKVETTVASTRVEALERPLGTRWLERWRRSPNRAPHGGSWGSPIERAIEGHPQFQTG